MKMKAGGDKKKLKRLLQSGITQIDQKAKEATVEASNLAVSTLDMFCHLSIKPKNRKHVFIARS